MHHRTITLVLLIVLFINACSPASAPPAETPTVASAESSPTRQPSPTILAAEATATSAPSSTPTAMPEPTPTATSAQAACAENGRVEFEQMLTALTPYPVDIRTYLPPCYEPEAAEGYPVLVIIHGQTYQYDQWDRLGMDEKADELILAGEVRPFIIVMPNEKDTYREPAESNFDQVVIEALVPWIKEKYNTCESRDCWAVGGLSRGATWAVHIGFFHPQVFGSIGGHSLTPFIGDVYALPYWLMRVKLEELPRFYLDMGEDDWHMEPVTEFMNKMAELGVSFEWVLDTGTHDEIYWEKHVEAYLRWYGAHFPALEGSG